MGGAAAAGIAMSGICSCSLILHASRLVFYGRQRRTGGGWGVGGPHGSACRGRVQEQIPDNGGSQSATSENNQLPDVEPRWSR